MDLKKLEGIDFKSKRVLVRIDLNVPIFKGKIEDTTRVESHRDTLLALQKKGAKVILLSHFGRPAQRKDPSLSLRPVLKTLEKILGHSVHFVNETIGHDAETAVSKMKDGDILLLENVRFNPGEEKNDPAFIKKLAKLGDCFVQDAFSVAHRKHASTVGLSSLLPTFCGYAVEKELAALEMSFKNPQRPLIAIIGGSKVSTKIDLLEALVRKVNALVIGGAMANTFLKAQGFSIGRSLYEKKSLETALSILSTAQKHNCSILLPIDAVVSWHFEENSIHRTYGIDAIPADGMILDVGDLSLERIHSLIDDAKTLIWNGPIGAFEMFPFDKGTVGVAKMIANATKSKNLYSIAGGGDTLSALNHAGVLKDFTYTSTAGGAFLNWLEGKPLPGLEILYKS